MKDLLVAVAYTLDNSCSEVLLVKNVDKQEFKSLVNEKNINKDKELKLESEKAKKISELQGHCNKHHYLIAKSLYDNFVDRGLIEDSVEFQQMFYEHIFDKKEFDLTKCPNEFLTIFDYVRGA